MSRQRFLLLVVLFILASVLVAPFVSFEADTRGYWIPWELATAGFRPWNAYLIEGCNYPPVILYVLGAVEVARSALQVAGSSRPNLLLLKLPSFAVQLIGAACVFRSLRGELGTRRALAIATAWLVSPALFVNAAMWCQWDAILSLFALFALLAARSGRPFATGAWAAVALATKVQAVFLLPALVVYAIARRDVGAAARAFAGAAVAVVVCFAPMAIAGHLRDATKVYVESVDTFPRRSLNAWNPWGVLNTIELRGISNPRQKAKVTSDSRAVAAWVTRRFTYKHLGLVLFGSYTAALAIVIARRPSIDAVLIGAPLCGVAMFMLATQMHERYLVPPAALMVLWWPLGRAYRWHFVYWSASAAMNQLFAMGRFESLGSFDPVAAFDEVGTVVTCLNLVAFAHLSWLFFSARRTAVPTAG